MCVSSLLAVLKQHAIQVLLVLKIPKNAKLTSIKKVNKAKLSPTTISNQLINYMKESMDEVFHASSFVLHELAVLTLAVGLSTMENSGVFRNLVCSTISYGCYREIYDQVFYCDLTCFPDQLYISRYNNFRKRCFIDVCIQFGKG